MKHYKIIILLLIAGIIGACTSPLDLNTERKKEPVVPIKKIFCSLDSITIKLNGEEQTFEFDTKSPTLLEIDTSYTNPFLRMKLYMKNTRVLPSISTKIIVTEFYIYIDSIEFKKSPIKLDGDSTDKAYTQFRLFRSGGAEADTIVYANVGKNTSEITFNIDTEQRVIWSALNTWIYDWKYTPVKVNGVDSLYKEQDSLSIQAGFRFHF